MKTKNKIIQMVSFFFLISLFIGLSSCSDNPVQQKNSGGVTEQGNFSVSSYPVSMKNTPTPDIIIKEAKIMIKDLKLHIIGTNLTSDDALTTIKVGPFVLYLNIDGGINYVSSTVVPANSYDKAVFKIHKVVSSDVALDPDFFDGTNYYSVIVKGTYKNEPFTFKSSVHTRQVLSFQTKTVVVNLTGNSNVTLKATPQEWFMNTRGVALNPNDENERPDIEQNIIDNLHNGFEIFLDNDRNGIPDGE